jgi:hypothetical protein
LSYLQDKTKLQRTSSPVSWCVLWRLPDSGMSGGRLESVNLESESLDTTRREFPGSGQTIESGPRTVPRDLLFPLLQKHRSLVWDGVPPTSSNPSLSQIRDEMCKLSIINGTFQNYPYLVMNEGVL